MFVITRLICRRIHGTSDVTVPKLSGFSIVSPKYVEVEYADGTKFKFSSEYLRVNSPAADGKIRSIGGDKVISGRRYVGIMSAEPVGNYGCLMTCIDDRTGIYPWDYFYELGSNKFSLMRNYIKTLQKHRLSREPPPPRRK
ncbi:hypothetical protein IGI04_024798 [Brassica rapa subsp. trilocularis]|uniref:Gamma-butyrobetaine hydroxylase-like N-terminal domain-containing protein n=1 Tax=Brassica rapa subsp. trilocularis TaxID=1813537 RepID=A0ABQ7M918_BRACM|nr:hypothetical protein IGI04_024798 [Brassica rapa subsp. trilocularis]